MKAIATVVFLLVNACSGDERMAGNCGNSGTRSAESAIVNGLSVSKYLKLSPTQLAAVGSVRPFDVVGDYCSGVAIQRDWVLTAKHCAWSPGLVFTAAGVTIDVSQQVTHPDLDILLLKLAEPLPAAVTPIHVLRHALSEQDVSRIVEIAGTGVADAGMSNGTRIAVSTILDVAQDDIAVGSMGLTGACDGDSGGPLLIRDDDASVAVAGVLSFGSRDCLGQDFYVRADSSLSWLTDISGSPATNDADGCQGLDDVGLCDGKRALWCNAGSATAMPCSEACGWDPAVSGYRCIRKADDGCSNSCVFGSCQGTVAHWCEHNVPMTAECSALGRICGFSPDDGHIECIAAPP